MACTSVVIYILYFPIPIHFDALTLKSLKCAFLINHPPINLNYATGTWGEIYNIDSALHCSWNQFFCSLEETPGLFKRLCCIVPAQKERHPGLLLASSSPPPQHLKLLQTITILSLRGHEQLPCIAPEIDFCDSCPIHDQTKFLKKKKILYSASCMHKLHQVFPWD